MSALPEDQRIVFEVQLDARQIPFLSEHRWRGVSTEAWSGGLSEPKSGIVVPGTAYLDMALAAAIEIFGEEAICVQDIEFHQALFLPEVGGKTVQMRLMPRGAFAVDFDVVSVLLGSSGVPVSFTKHVSGKISLLTGGAAHNEAIATLKEVRSRCKTPVTKAEHDMEFKNRGFDYGPSFKVVAQLWQGKDEAVGEITLDAELQKDASRYYMHPGVLDSCFQVGGSALPSSLRHEAFIPVSIENYQLFSRPTARMWSHVYQVQVTHSDENKITVGVTIYSDTGRIIATVPRLHVKRIERGALTRKESSNNYANAMYRVCWKREDAIIKYSGEGRQEPGAWLIFADHSGVGEKLADHLFRSRRLPSILVYAGDELCLGDEGHITVVPGVEEHLQALFEQLKNNITPVTKLVYLWGLDNIVDLSVSDGLQDTATQTGVYTVVQLLRMMSRYRSSLTPCLWLVTRGLQAKEKIPDSALLQYPLWGLGRAIAQEVPGSWGGLVDLDLSASDNDVENLIHEITNPASENQVAYHNKMRYVARLSKMGMEIAPQRNIQLDSNSTYIITGGLGGLGRQLLVWLAQRGARHLVIITRTPLVDKSYRNDESDGAERDRKSEVIQTLEREGVNLHIMVGDVEDKGRLADIFRTVRKKLPPLKGIFHAAGVLDDAPLNAMNRQRLAKVMEPKIKGAWNLHTLSLDCELEFFILFSSIASVLGSPGQSNYCAANAFLDGLARYRCGRNLPAVSINWGPWAGEGMTESIDLDRLVNLGLHTLDPDSDWHFLDIAMTSKEVGPVIVRMDWGVFSKSQVVMPVSRFVEEQILGGHSPSVDNSEEAAARGYTKSTTVTDAQPTEHTLDQCYRLVNDEVVVVLGLGAGQRLDIDEPLINYGFESLMALRLKNNLENKIGRPLPNTLAYDYPSIKEISTYLSSLFTQRDPGGVSGVELVTSNNDMEQILELLLEVESVQDDKYKAQT
ncbi:MAG: SDR family NAD(P)-dependent oxidoreductase [Gammaproteobacteria bacterium]|nr:SDR family NAD(P)-dependent oxidoreductase [Gammaproteobacteria bacterium]